MFNNSPHHFQSYPFANFTDLNQGQDSLAYFRNRSFQEPYLNQENYEFADPSLRKRKNLMFSSPNIKKNLIMTSPLKYSPLYFQNPSRENQFDDIQLSKLYDPAGLQQLEEKKNINNNQLQIKKSIYSKIDFSQCEDLKTPIKIKVVDSSLNDQNEKSTVKKIQKDQIQNFEKIIKIPLKNDHQYQNKVPKGLRDLSQSVKQIVLSVKKSTYKDVADILITRLQTERKINRNSKDEQNIKRRVYDALNVLISAGILKKQGKMVLSQDQQKNKHSIDYIEEKRSLQEKIKLMKLNIKEKYQKLTSLKNKFFANQYLINRNKTSAETKYHNKYNNAHKRIAFPFICIVTKKNSVNYYSTTSKKDLQFGFKNEGFKIMGDIDAILKLKLHEKVQDSRLLKEIVEFTPEQEENKKLQ